MKSILIISSIIFTFTTFMSVQAGKVYKWTDENGVTHYSNSGPPEDAKDVKQDDEIIHSPDDQVQSKENDQKLQKIIQELEAENRKDEAESKLKKQKKRAEKETTTKNRLNQNIQTEKEWILKEIEKINGLAVGKSYSQAWKKAQLKKYQDMLELLEKSPEKYFAGKKNKGSRY